MTPLTLRTPEVRELLASGECEVRRKIKVMPIDWISMIFDDGDLHFYDAHGEFDSVRCPPPAVGSGVWCRETWMPVDWGSYEPITGKAYCGVGYHPCILYAADPASGHGDVWDDRKSFWSSPAVQPRWASRLAATVESITAEQRDGEWEWVCRLKRKDQMIYGLLDTVDNCWFGDGNGPRTFDDLLLARLAAQTIDMQLGNKPGRTRATEYDSAPKRLRDTLKTRMGTLEALDAMENGRLM